LEAGAGFGEVGDPGDGNKAFADPVFTGYSRIANAGGMTHHRCRPFRRSG